MLKMSMKNYIHIMQHCLNSDKYSSVEKIIISKKICTLIVGEYEPMSSDAIDNMFKAILDKSNKSE